MLFQLTHTQFVMGGCGFVLILLFVLAALLDVRNRKEIQFRKFKTAFAHDGKLPSAYVDEDGVVDPLPTRLAELSDRDSLPTEGRPAIRGMTETSSTEIEAGSFSRQKPLSSQQSKSISRIEQF